MSERPNVYFTIACAWGGAVLGVLIGITMKLSEILEFLRAGR